MRRTKLLIIEANATVKDMYDSGISASVIGNERAGDGIIYSYDGEAYSHHEYEFEDGKIGVASLSWAVDRNGDFIDNQSAEWITVRDAKKEQKELLKQRRIHQLNDFDEAMNEKYGYFNTRNFDPDMAPDLSKKNWKIAVKYVKALESGRRRPSLPFDLDMPHPHRNA